MRSIKPQCVHLSVSLLYCLPVSVIYIICLEKYCLIFQTSSHPVDLGNNHKVISKKVLATDILLNAERMYNPLNSCKRLHTPFKLGKRNTRFDFSLHITGAQWASTNQQEVEIAIRFPVEFYWDHVKPYIYISINALYLP